MYTYMVSNWDTVDTIAIRFGIPGWVIMNENHIHHPTLLCSGMIIRIPCKTCNPLPEQQTSQTPYIAPYPQPVQMPFMPQNPAHSEIPPYHCMPGLSPYPFMPTVPKTPSCPLMPNIPEMPSYSSMPGMMPSMMPGMMPETPSCPPMPSIPGVPYYPYMPEMPAFPPEKSMPCDQDPKDVVPPLGTIDYIVQPGDTVYQLAKKYNTTMYAIIRVNNLMNPDMIIAGKLLKIPVSPPEAIIYTVKTGDSLYKIAQKYHTTVDEIASFNYLINPNSIYPGQQLIIAASLK